MGLNTKHPKNKKERNVARDFDLRKQNERKEKGLNNKTMARYKKYELIKEYLNDVS